MFMDMTLNKHLKEVQELAQARAFENDTPTPIDPAK